MEGRYAEGLLEQVKWRSQQKRDEQLNKITVAREVGISKADYARYREVCDICKVLLKNTKTSRKDGHS